MYMCVWNDVWVILLKNNEDVVYASSTGGLLEYDIIDNYMHTELTIKSLKMMHKCTKQNCWKCNGIILNNVVCQPMTFNIFQHSWRMLDDSKHRFQGGFILDEL